MSAVPDDVDRIQGLWFDGAAWCKVAWFDARVPSAPPYRPFEKRLRDAVTTWRRTGTEDAGAALVALLIDDLLCEQLPESSDFAEFERGPWVACPAEEAIGFAVDLDRRRGCEGSAAALPWFQARAEGALGVWRCDHPYADGVVVLDTHLAAFFLDPG